MARLTSLGIKVGARKVDCEKYMPDPGDWEETNVIWDFGDGWLICEDRTPYDRKLMAKLTLTCIGSGEVYDRMWPGEVKDAAYWARETEALTEKYVKGRYFMSDEAAKSAAEEEISYKKAVKCSPVYRMMHVRDPKQRPRAAILLCMAEIADGTKKLPGEYLGYIKGRDLAQTHPIILDDIAWHVLECRIGTGNGAPTAIMTRICQWYAEATGQWDEKAYQEAKPQVWHAVKTQETNLDKFRTKSLATA